MHSGDRLCRQMRRPRKARRIPDVNLAVSISQAQCFPRSAAQRLKGRACNTPFETLYRRFCLFLKPQAAVQKRCSVQDQEEGSEKSVGEERFGLLVLPEGHHKLMNALYFSFFLKKQRQRQQTQNKQIKQHQVEESCRLVVPSSCANLQLYQTWGG